MDGFSQWARRHCVIFGLTEPKHMEMVTSWQDLFQAAGYCAVDLNDATDWLANNAPPRFASEHLGALTRRMREVRSVRAIRDDDREVALCVKCGGPGRLSVPLLRSIRQGEWRPYDAGAGPVYYTEAVACDCERGRLRDWSITDRATGNRVPMMTIADYELANPHYRQQLIGRHRELVERSRVTSGPLCKGLDEILRRLDKSREG